MEAPVRLRLYRDAGPDVRRGIAGRVQHVAWELVIEDICFLDSLPGLVVMERIFFRIVAVGFVCLTLVLLTGSFATHEMKGTWLLMDHKTLLTWIAWVIFGLLLGGRRFAGWRAKTALNWFWVLVIAYVGYSFIREIF